MSIRTPVPAYAEWLSSSITRYESLAKSLVAHKGEKGRIVEDVLRSALRAVLPGRFAIGTGFIITSSGRASSQTDIVIYDSIWNAPIILGSGAGLFPIESVYGFIEVKSSLGARDLEGTAKAIGTIRSLADEKSYVSYGSVKDANNNPILKIEEDESKLAPRSFVVACNTRYARPRSLVQKLRSVTEQNHAHMHGLVVISKNWFIHQLAYKSPHEFAVRQRGAFRAFCSVVLTSIQSMPMGPAPMHRYLDIDLHT